MLSPGISVKRRHGGAGFALRCGCKDAKSVSVSTSPSPSGAGTSTTTETRGGAGRTNPSASTTTTDTLTSSLTSASSSSFVWEDAVAELDCSDDYGRDSSAAAQSFSGLLRELNELEQSVASWGQQKSHRNKKLSTPPQQEDRDEKRLSTPTQEGRVDKKLSTPPREHKKLSAPMQEDHVDKELPTPPREHRKVTPMKSGDHLTLTKGAKAGYRAGDRLEAAGHAGLAEAGLDGSVAVVKQSDDPLGDFRRSMVQMIVENGMVAGEELREMLRRFLSLNAPHHHDVILRAFAEIWAAVFEDEDEDEDSWRDEPDAPATAVPAHKRTTRREPSPSSRPPTMPRTPPRHHHSPSAWRV
uniref:Uncharacterized protein n=1 Tax=Avena sativa TaxID=4498 RepID=A0ACD5YSF7_AVESA